MKYFIRLISFTSSFLILSGCGQITETRNQVQASIEWKHPKYLFSENTVLPLTITAPISLLFDEKENFPLFDVDDGEWGQRYHKGELEVGGQDFEVKLRARGQTRLGCEFPPFKIKLAKSENRGTFLRGLSGLKTISHCENNRDVEHRYMREVAIYELAKVIFPDVLKIRPLHITYVDTQEDTEQAWRGAALETLKDAAKRLNKKPVKVDPLYYEVAWYAWDEDAATESLRNFYVREVLKDKYLEFEETYEDDELSKEELSELLQQYVQDHQAKIWEMVTRRTAKRISMFQSELKVWQKGYLGRVDRTTAMRLVLFAFMIGQQDYNVFGLNPDQDQYALRNIEIVEGIDGTLYPIPYDFDATALAQGQVLDHEYFKQKLESAWTGQEGLLAKFFEDFDLETGKKDFLSYEQELLEVAANLPVHKCDREVFAETITIFFSELKDFKFPGK